MAISCVGTAFCTALLKERCIQGRIEVRRRWKEDVSSYGIILNKSRHWKLKEEALDRTLWRTNYRRVHGPVVWQTTE